MPQSSDLVVRHAPFFTPFCGSAVSDWAGDWRPASETHPGPRAGTGDCSNPPLTIRFRAGLKPITWSNVAVFKTDGLMLVTARPPGTVDGSARLTNPIGVQMPASVD